MRLNKGSTLIEVLFAIGVIAVCLVGLSMAVVAAVKNAGFAKQSVIASQYAQEGLEVVRKERDRNTWQVFKDTFEDNYGYCIGPYLGHPSCNCDGFSPFSPNLDGIFYRCVFIEDEDDGDPLTEIKKITVNVRWIEGGRSHNTQAVTFLSKWSN